MRLRALREVRGWSQAELARRSGVNQAVISRLESGTTQAISFPNLEKLAAALECDPGYLIVRSPAPAEAGTRRARRRVPR